MAGATEGGARPARLAGLPAGVPPAGREPQAALPGLPRREWPFPPESFPHTEGASRLAGGALYWTGFVYGDHGAKGVDVRPPVSPLAPSVGTYVYPSGGADGNGANIFGAAVGLSSRDTWWRVSWNTLADEKVPIAEWAFGSGKGPTTSKWPAGAGVTSPSEGYFLLVSSKGAWLTRAGGKTRSVTSFGGASYVDRRSRSFIVRLPRAALDPEGSWRIRLVAGLAAPNGRSFAPVTAADGARPGEPSVYDVGFRTYQQERPELKPNSGADPAGLVSALNGLTSRLGAKTDYNFWADAAQATALAAGTVKPFSIEVNWSRLSAKVTTPEPQPTGWTDRWYVSSLRFGQGVRASTSQLSPNYLGRVQPYGVYVPTTYRRHKGAAVTFLLHSLDVNLNQYAADDPRLIMQFCQRRGSICATPESRGAGGWYLGYAQVDFWQVWHALAASYHLLPRKTVIGGYSMGGYASYEIGLQYPDLFAKAVSLSGPPTCGIRVVKGADAPPGAGECASDGETAPLVRNARWLPYIIEQGAADELVPVAGVLQQVKFFDSAGERYLFELFPAEDHLVNATQDEFASEAAAVASPSVVRNPASFSFTWYPSQVSRRLGIGPTGDYWVHGLVASSRALGRTATVRAHSFALSEPSITIKRSSSLDPTASPTPAAVRRLYWTYGRRGARRRLLELTFTNVSAAKIDLARAGFRHDSRGTARVCSDKELLLTLESGSRRGKMRPVRLRPGCHRISFRG